MIERLPEGRSIGWMQAPPNWIFTHTVRFVGIVRVVIQDGEGFILINKGKPLVYYFKHGRIELRGHSALDYFNSHPTIEFNLCKYTPEEFAEALKICNVDEPVPAAAPAFEVKPPVVVTPPAAPEPQKPPVQPAPPVMTKVAEPEPVRPVPEAPAPPPPAPVADITFDEPEPAPARAEPEELFEPVAETPAEKPAARQYSRPVPPAPPALTRFPEVPPRTAAPSAPVELDENAIRIIGQIKKLNGIVAISVFNEERNIILMGDVEIEPLLKIARSMLATTRKISPNLEWGSFVHMTLQIPEGNIIIAPYLEYHLCLLTTRTINIGHIRRILRDLQVSGGR